MSRSDRDAKWIEGLRADPPLPAGVKKLRRVVSFAISAALPPRRRATELDLVTDAAVSRVLATLDGFEEQCRFVTWLRAVSVEVALRPAPVEAGSECEAMAREFAACCWVETGGKTLSPRFDAVVAHKRSCASCHAVYKALLALEAKPERRPKP